MIASLPMYDRPANAAAHDVFWQLIRDNLRAAGVDAPDALDRESDYMAGWAATDLVLGQICNLPYRARFRGKVTVIGAADYGLADCDAGYYRSVFVVRRGSELDRPEDATAARFTYSDVLSQSGYGAAMQYAAEHGFTLNPILQTGSHAASLAAVAGGLAEIATLDAQTWRMMQDDDPNAAQVRVIGVTQATPCMTFITRKGQDPAPYFTAITSAIGDLPDAARATLGLRDIVRLPDSAYEFPLPPPLPVAKRT